MRSPKRSHSSCRASCLGTPSVLHTHAHEHSRSRVRARSVTSILQKGGAVGGEGIDRGGNSIIDSTTSQCKRQCPANQRRCPRPRHMLSHMPRHMPSHILAITLLAEACRSSSGVHTRVCVHACMCVRACACVHVRACMCVRPCVRPCVRVLAHVRLCVSSHIERLEDGWTDGYAGLLRLRCRASQSGSRVCNRGH